MRMIKHRNESSHTYNDDVAAQIMAAVQDSYLPAFQAFQQRFRAMEAEEGA